MEPNINAIYTVVAHRNHGFNVPFTIGSYSSIMKAEKAIESYFGTRCKRDWNATHQTLATIATYRVDELNVYIVVHDLDDKPAA